MKTTWVNKKSGQPFDVYVGRPSAWGNPFSHLTGTLAEFQVGSREEAIAAFREWFLQQPELCAKARRELKGKVLGCWCAPQDCHARVLAEVADQEETMTETVKLEFWTDGSAPVQHGPTGAGIVGRSGPHYREWSIPLGEGTNQTAELAAVREALKKVKNPDKTHVIVHTDSAYALGCLTNPTWAPKANVALIQETKSLIGKMARFEMSKVAGHTGHTENERADVLARAAADGVVPELRTLTA